jgi:hypothetical protein
MGGKARGARRGRKGRWRVRRDAVTRAAASRWGEAGQARADGCGPIRAIIRLITRDQNQRMYNNEQGKGANPSRGG